MRRIALDLHARAAVAALEAVAEEASSRQRQRARERAVRNKHAGLEAAFKEFARLEAANGRVDRVQGEARAATVSGARARESEDGIALGGAHHNIQQWIRLRRRAPLTAVASA